MFLVLVFFFKKVGVCVDVYRSANSLMLSFFFFFFGGGDLDVE